eukprot:SAG11_NODE_13427_length_655_cov_1.642086_1_plen_105_part_10
MRSGRSAEGYWNDNALEGEAGHGMDMAGCYGCYGTYGMYPLCETTRAAPLPVCSNVHTSYISRRRRRGPPSPPPLPQTLRTAMALPRPTVRTPQSDAGQASGYHQ